MASTHGDLPAPDGPAALAGLKVLELGQLMGPIRQGTATMSPIKLLATLAATLVLAGCASRVPERPLSEPVQTEAGLVSGDGQDVRAFRGIPYALAPVGPLRWQPPQPAAPWTGVHDGSRFGPDCMQPAEYPELRGTGMSEDCLSVNVWTPARTNRERLPVMVWVYGGAFTYGSGSHPSYDGEALARRGIVVVTFNYRMGLFGYLAHPQLSAESPSRSSGAYALLDQLAALRWVQRNIGAFGGDPARVTVAGQSAGAMSISAMMISGRADGLFQQAILQSVGAMRPMSDLRSAEAFGQTVGTDLAQLRATPAADLVKRLKELTPPGREVTSARGIGIIVDGDVVPRDDMTAYSQGRYMKVPMIVGTVANEGGGIGRSLGVMGVKTVTDLRAYLARNFQGHEAKALSAYAASSDAEVPGVLADLASDTQFLYGTRELLRMVAAREPRQWRYVFTQRRNGAATEPIHGAELQYPFDTLQAPHRGRPRPFDATDAALARQMADTWARFVKTGDPNGGDLASWPRTAPGAERFLEFGTPTRTGSFGPAPRLDFIRDYYQQTAKPAVPVR